MRNGHGFLKAAHLLVEITRTEDLRAVEYVLLAADQAGRGWAKDEAAALYGAALDLIPASDEVRRREISRKRAVSLAAFAHVEDARHFARRSESERS